MASRGWGQTADRTELGTAAGTGAAQTDGNRHADRYGGTWFFTPSTSGWGLTLGRLSSLTHGAMGGKVSLEEGTGHARALSLEPPGPRGVTASQPCLGHYI